MKHPKTNFFTCLLLAICLLLPTFFLVGCNEGSSDVENGENVETSDTNNSVENNTSDLSAKLNKFYETVVESQTRMDIVADGIYSYWYDAIYKDKYSGSIDLAIAFALSDNSENIDFIKSNETVIQSLYKEVRNSKLKDEVKDVMNAYSDYYEFVINVSGSFNTYSANKETYKKALANALKHLSMEL